MKFVLATNNIKKVAEIRDIFVGSALELISLDEFETQPEMEETKETFLENAYQKASVIMGYFNMPAIADDSGLEVDALNGEPGVYSKRFAGKNASDRENNEKLIRELSGVSKENRSARFKTVAVCVFVDGRRVAAVGELEGMIILDERGRNGFGYDPFFVPDGQDLTFAQMPLEMKNSISHRGKAFRALRAALEKEISSGL